jgi:hypothetical protein
MCNKGSEVGAQFFVAPLSGGEAKQVRPHAHARTRAPARRHADTHAHVRTHARAQTHMRTSARTLAHAYTLTRPRTRIRS